MNADKIRFVISPFIFNDRDFAMKTKLKRSRTCELMHLDIVNKVVI